MNAALHVFQQAWPAGVLLIAVGFSVCLAMGTKPYVRFYLRLAAAFYVSWAVTVLAPPLEIAIRPIATTTALSALCLSVFASFRRPPGAGVVWGVMGGAVMSGVLAAVFGEALITVLSQTIAVVTMLGISRRGVLRFSGPSLQLAGGTGALTAGLCMLLVPNPAGMTGPFLFSAAGLLGVCLAVARISDTLPPRTKDAERKGSRQAKNLPTR